MTSCGLNGRPLIPDGSFPAAICCNLTNGRMPHLSNIRKNPSAPNFNHDEKDVFVNDIENHTLIGYKHFKFEGTYQLSVTTRGSDGVLVVRTGSEEQQEIARIHLEKGEDWKKSQYVTVSLNGVKPLYLTYEGSRKVDFLEFCYK